MTKILRNKSNIDLDYPICRPSLDLDFTQERLDPRITFSRGSIGTRVNRNRLIETVSANQPRFDYDPVTGECKGLLIEESRTNLLTYSNTFTNSIWNGSSVTRTDNATTSPDGTTNACLISNSGTTYGGMLRYYYTFSAIPYTFSCFVKKINWRYIGIRIVGSIASGNFYPVFDLDTQTFLTNSVTGITLSYQAFPNGWYRISLTYTPTAGSSVLDIVLVPANGDHFSRQGQNVYSAYVYGAQLEAGSFPTSYIPTTASTVTRSVDNADMTGRNFSSWYNSTEGSLFVAARVNALGGSGFPGIAYVDDGTVNNCMGFYVNDAVSDNIGAESYISGRAQYTLFSSSATTANKLNKAISSYSINNFSGAFDTSSQIQRDTSGSIPTVDRLRIGALRGDVYKLNGTISRLTYYPKALSPAELQYLTQ